MSVVSASSFVSASLSASSSSSAPVGRGTRVRPPLGVAPEIQTFLDEGFALMNVDENKHPRMKGWNKVSKEELSAVFDPFSSQVALRVGPQDDSAYIVSLDFDIYDKSTKADCPETSKHLKRYLERRRSSEGHYTSSTEGNHNVLVNIAGCPPLLEAVERAGNPVKCGKDHLELFVRAQNQVIPPTQTINKKTGVLGPPRRYTSSSGAGTYFVPEDPTGDVVAELVMMCLDECARKKAPKVGVGRAFDVEVHEGKDDDKFVDLLMNVIGNRVNAKGEKEVKWDFMFQIAAILKTNGYSEAVFQRWMEPQDLEGAENDMWRVERKETFSVYGLYNIAREVNEPGFLAWLKQNRSYDRLLTSQLVEEGDLTVARFMAVSLARTLVSSPLGTWYACDPRTHIWSARKDVSTQVVIAICAELDWTLVVLKSLLAQKEAEEKAAAAAEEKAADVVDAEGELELGEGDSRVAKETYLDKLFRRLQQQVQSASRKSNVMAYLRDLLMREDADTMFLPAVGTLAFQNGVYSMEARKFTYGISPEQHVCVLNQFLYEEPEPTDYDEARHELLKILNYNETHLAYMLSVLGYSMTGLANRETGFWYLRGQTAANGKSTLFDILRAVFPVFVGEIENKAFDVGEDCNKTVAGWTGKRIMYLPELTTAKKQDSIIKNIADGVSIEYKRLYVAQTQSMRVTFKMFMVSNHTLRISSCDGLKRRFVNCQFNSRFVDGLEVEDPANLKFRMNKKLTEWFGTRYRNAMVKLLLDAASDYYERGGLLPCPTEWVKDSEEVMAYNNVCAQWAEDHLRFGVHPGTTTKRMLTRTRLAEMLQKNPLRTSNWRDEFARMGKGITFDSQKRIPKGHPDFYGTVPKGVFEGVGEPTPMEVEAEAMGDEEGELQAKRPRLE